LRLDDVEAEVATLTLGAPRVWERPDRAFFLHALRGTVRVERQRGGPITLTKGDSLGVEKGARLELRSAEDGARLFISSIPRRHAYIANLTNDVILIPASEQPAAALLASTVETLRIELDLGRGDVEIVRRLCEVIMLQLLRQVRSGVVGVGEAPKAILHDEHILRAWSAYFGAPAAPWTVEKLADAAGLSRSAFFDRFRSIFGAPPLETLTRIRLDQAKQLLRASKAPLQVVALQVGYQSETALIRAFKREFGLSPGQWRRREAMA
jgi:AraC-like DNA-binding protein